MAWIQFIQGAQDKIVFGAGITQNELTFRQIGTSLYIYVDEELTQGVIISSFYSNSGDNYKIEKLEFADGTSISLTESLTLVGQNGDETITGTDFDDTIYG